MIAPDREIAALFKLRRFGIELGLDRVREVAARLGHPERAFRVVHVAGTNGKGSTAAICASILRAAGHRVGLTTSPHLVRLHERFLVNSHPIPSAALARQIARIRAIGVQLTFFEFTTLIAFLHFAEQRVDWGVVEVGLGGRLDATNIVTPDVVVLTPVALDHTEHLGDTLAAIAHEKLGIVKNGVPVVCGWSDPQIRRIAVRTCRDRSSPLSLINRDFRAQPVAPRAAGELFTYSDDATAARDGTRFSHRLSVPLAGLHQVSNAALAIRAMGLMGVRAPTIRRGLARVRWPGRFQRVARFIVDGAHNPHGIGTLVAEFSRRFPGRRVPIVFAAMRDKAIPEMLRDLAPFASAFHFVCVDRDRGTPTAALSGVSSTLGIAATRHATLSRALAATHGPTLVTGSLTLVGAAIALLHRPRN